MYKTKPPTTLRCSRCNTIVKVDANKMLLSQPPRYKWTCPYCGEKGVVFENQISGGFTTTNATIDDNIDNATPAIYSTTTECEICGEEFKYDAKHMHICPKCREAVMKVRKDIYDAQHNIGSYGCTVYCNSFNQPKVTVDDTVCGGGSVSVSSRKAIDGDIKLTIQGYEIE